MRTVEIAEADHNEVLQRVADVWGLRDCQVGNAVEQRVPYCAEVRLRLFAVDGLESNCNGCVQNRSYN